MKPHYEECIVFMLGKAYQTAHKLFKNKLEAHGLTPVQFLVLEVLWIQEPVTIGDISSQVAMDYATLSNVLDRMVKSEWVQKEKDPADKRVWQVSLTEKAHRMKQIFMVEQEETNRQMTETLSESEKLLLFRILKDLRHVES